MFPFLRRLDEYRLQRLVREVAGPGIVPSSEENADRVLFACFGYDLLREKSVRRALLATLSMMDLTELAASTDKGPLKFTKIADAALVLAQVPWKAGTAFVKDFARKLGIGAQFLPQRAADIKTIEVVEPTVAPPPLLNYQQEVVNAALDELQGLGRGKMLIQLPTGSGKTRTAMEIVCDWMTQSKAGSGGGSVVWLAHTQELCDQAVDSLRRLWLSRGDRELAVVRMWGQYEPRVDDCVGAVVVAGNVKLAGRLEQEQIWRMWMAQNVGLLVVDEAHRAIAPTVRRLIETAQVGGSRLIGLTATPGRGVDADRENRELRELFGTLIRPSSLEPDPIEKLQAMGVLANVRRQSLLTNIPLEERDWAATEDEDVSAHLLRRLAENSERNRLIVDQIREFCECDRTILVYACTVDHARQLALSLASQGVRAAYVDHTMRRGVRTSMTEALRRGEIQVLVNFGVLSTGFDAPNVSVVVVTRPTSSIVLYSQMIGRGLRGPAVGGTQECIVVDVRDNAQEYGPIAEVYRHFDRYWAA